jgi:hypothetical protein
MPLTAFLWAIWCRLTEHQWPQGENAWRATWPETSIEITRCQRCTTERHRRVGLV